MRTACLLYWPFRKRLGVSSEKLKGDEQSKKMGYRSGHLIYLTDRQDSP